MNQASITLIGALICCVVPLACFAAGVYYARFGLPFIFRWRGFNRITDADED